MRILIIAILLLSACCPSLDTPKPRFVRTGIDWAEVDYILDTKTGREYLANRRGGILDITPQPENSR